MAVRGVRGAISIPENSADAIIDGTRTMVRAALEANGIDPGDIAAIVFAVTNDLDAAFPAAAARDLGLTEIPLLDFVSPQVKGAMPRVVRMLLLWNTDRPAHDVRHVYLGDAQALRPDLARRWTGGAEGARRTRGRV